MSNAKNSVTVETVVGSLKTLMNDTFKVTGQLPVWRVALKDGEELLQEHTVTVGRKKKTFTTPKYLVAWFKDANEENVKLTIPYNNLCTVEGSEHRLFEKGYDSDVAVKFSRDGRAKTAKGTFKNKKAKKFANVFATKVSGYQISIENTSFSKAFEEFENDSTDV